MTATSYLSLLLIACIIHSTTAFSQQKEERFDDHLSVSTGVSISSFKAFSFQYAFEYQKNINNNLLFGIGYDRHQLISKSFRPTHTKSLPVSESIISGNLYYNMEIVKNRLYVLSGIGLGLMHANWDNAENNPIRPVANISITMAIRVSEHFELQFSPFVITNRFYYSPFNIDTYKSYNSLNLFSFGFRYNF